MKNSLKQMRYWPILLAGILISVAGSAYIFQLTDEAFKAEIVAWSKDHSSAIRERLTTELSPIEATAALFASSNNVEPDEFDTFAREISHHAVHDFTALGWVPAIPTDHRKAFEQHVSVYNGYADYRIHDRPGTQQRDTTTSYPVYLLAQFNHTYKIRGLDLASIPAVAMQIQQAKKSVETVLLPLSELLQDETDPALFLAIHPKYRDVNSQLSAPKTSQPPPIDTFATHALDGYVFEIIDMKRLMERALQNTPSAGLDIIVYDQDRGVKRLIFFHPSRRHESPPSLTTIEAKMAGGMIHHNETLQSYGHQFELIFAPIQSHSSLQTVEPL